MSHVGRDLFMSPYELRFVYDARELRFVDDTRELRVICLT